jgi:glycosyltransferase involved in cell wall biosynthesis
MNIALISEALPYLPSRGGFRLYGANLIRCLSQRHKIDLIAFLQDDDEQHLNWPRQYCASVSGLPGNGASMPTRLANVGSAYLRGTPIVGRKQLAARLQEGVAAGRWDVLHVEGEYAGGLIPAGLPVAKVLSVHDSWTLRADEMLKCTQNWRQKLYYTFLKYHEPRYERLVYPRFERCTVVAGPDLDEVRKTVPSAKVELISYGTDTEYFHPINVPKQPDTLVFHSHLGYPPNIEAALEFANEIFPLIRREAPQVTFHLVGANPDPKVQELASRPGIKISANLPDLRGAVCSAGIYVCAIRHGTGLKSKMLEAMAMQMPIVGYHPGSTVGIDCVYGEQLLAATTPQEFAAHVLHLLKNPAKAEEMAKAARKLVCEKYSWESRARAYEELYLQVKEERRKSSPGYAKRSA